MKLHYITKVFGLSFAYVPPRGFIGNCFSPAIVLERKGRCQDARPAQFVLTLRTRWGYETTFYWNGRFRFWWNSAHLARWFGKHVDTDFGGYHQWRGHIAM